MEIKRNGTQASVKGADSQTVCRAGSQKSFGPKTCLPVNADDRLHFRT
jgi:hypothetical protein